MNVDGAAARRGGSSSTVAVAVDIAERRRWDFSSDAMRAGLLPSTTRELSSGRAGGGGAISSQVLRIKSPSLTCDNVLSQ